MASENSDRACTLCRQRRVRCDKSLPTCRRCSKFGQECPGYPSRQRFIDQSSLVRNKLNDQSSPSSSASGQHHSTSLESSPRTVTGVGSRAARTRRTRNSRFPEAGSNHARTVPVPRRASTSIASDHVPLIPPTSSRQQAAPENSLPVVPPNDDFMVDVSMQQLLEDSGSDYFDLDIDSYYANGTNACGFFPGIPVSLPSEDGLGILDGIHDSHMKGSSGPVSPTTSGARSSMTLNKEVALLVHLFVDFLAPWMDLFDFDAYFTRVLPVDATPNILLQSAVAAVAAKQTARHVMNGCAQPASRHYEYIMATYQDVTSNEWFYKAACYYDRGISHLRAQLQQSSMFLSGHPSPQSSSLPARSFSDHPMQLSAMEEPCQVGIKATNAHCLYSAISIFSLYETLDDCLATSSQ